MNDQDERLFEPDDSRIVRAPDEQSLTDEIKRIMDMPGCLEGTKWLLGKAIEVEAGRLILYDDKDILDNPIQCCFLRPCATPQRCLSAETCLGNCEHYQ